MFLAYIILLELVGMNSQNVICQSLQVALLYYYSQKQLLLRAGGQ